MSGVSTRALINFVVDAAIAAAFVVSAASGLVFLVPASWLSPAGSPTSALGIEYATWRTLHDWTAVIMVAGVLLHTALHWRWIVTMTLRIFGGRPHARPAAAPVPDASAFSSAAVVAPDAFAGSARARREPAEARREPAEARREPAEARREPAEARREPVVRQTLTRHAFLRGAGAVGAAALVGGLVGRAAAGAAVTWLDDGSATRAGSTTASLEQDSAGGWGSDAEALDSPSSSGAAGAAQTTPTARVTIDAGRCNGCGACLQVCPFAVFSAEGGTVVVADESACRLCGHCVQVCRAGAITLNG